MSREFEDRVGRRAPMAYSTAGNDNGAGGWYIAQGLNEVAKAAKILADNKELR